MAFVVVEEKGSQVLRTELRGPAMSIGRDESNDIRLENRALSRKHAQLEVRGAGIWIRDLGSQNGTFINGERLEGAKPIQGGDVISLGGKFQLRLEGVEEAKTTTPVLTLTGPEGTHRFAMVGEEIVLGRSPDCDISIGRKSISRRHLRVLIKDGKFFAEDMGSQNGTRVNGEKIRGVTGIAPDDEIRISEYTIRVGYLEQAEGESENDSQPAKPSRTMLLDRSKLAATADLGGDFEVQVTHENRLTFNIGDGPAGDKAGPGAVDWVDGDELGETVGPAKVPGPPPIPPRPTAASARPAPQKPAPPSPRAAPPPPAPVAAARPTSVREASIDIVHADGSSRAMKLGKEVVCLAEDGSEGGPPTGVTYAPVGYVLLAPLQAGWMVTAVGDRRFVQVAGRPAAVHMLHDGDIVKFGGLQLTFRS